MSKLLRNPWLSFVLCCLILAMLFARVRRSEHLAEFGTYWSSGQAAHLGLNPYVAYPRTWRFRAFADNGPLITDINLNPPALLPLFSFMSRFEPAREAVVYSACSIFLFIATTAFLIRRYRPAAYQVWWLMTGGAIFGTVYVRQNYVLLYACSAAAWICLENDYDLFAGVFLGLLSAMKPNFLLWPTLLALSGRRKQFAPAAITFGVVSAVPVLLYGANVYFDWFRALLIDDHWIFPDDVSFIATTTRFGIRPLGYVLAAGVLCYVFMLARRRTLTPRQVSGLALCTGILCAPVAWVYYVLALVPIMLGRRWSIPELLAAAALWIQSAYLQPHPHMSPIVEAAFGLVHPAAFLLLAVTFAQRRPLIYCHAMSVAPKPAP